MGQMKETLQDSPEVSAYEEHIARTEVLNKLTQDLLAEIGHIEFTVRILHDNVVEFFNEINK